MAESAASPAGRVTGDAAVFACRPGVFMIAVDTTVITLAPPLIA